MNSLTDTVLLTLKRLSTAKLVANTEKEIDTTLKPKEPNEDSRNGLYAALIEARERFLKFKSQHEAHRNQASSNPNSYFTSDRNQTSPLRAENELLKQKEQTPDEPTLYSAFDPDYYRRTNWWDIAKYNLDPLAHFINHGAMEGRNPNSWFDCNFYRAKYMHPESKENPLEHYLRIGYQQGHHTNRGPIFSLAFEDYCKVVLGKDVIQARKDYINSMLGVKQRMEEGELGNQLKKMAITEPLVMHGTLDGRNWRRPFIASEIQLKLMTEMALLHHAVDQRTFSAILILPWIKLGGADKVAGMVANVLSTQFGEDEVLILTTEQPPDQAQPFLSSTIKVLDISQLRERLGAPEYQRLFFEFLRSIDPRVIININSGLMWSLPPTQVAALSEHTRLGAFLFCDDLNYVGDVDGYPCRYFHQQFDLLDFIATDSAYLKTKFISKFMLPEKLTSKVPVVSMPISSEIANYERSYIGNDSNPIIYWSGRFDYQKRPDILLQVARARPNWTFFIWGKMVLGDSRDTLTDLPPNVQYRGIYQFITDIPLDLCAVWMYTSMWDGVPNLLLEVAGLGIPIVGTNKDGGAEVIDEDSSFIIHDIEDISSYIAGIELVLSGREAAEQRARARRQKLLSERTFDNFEATIKLQCLSNPARHLNG